MSEHHEPHSPTTPARAVTTLAGRLGLVALGAALAAGAVIGLGGLAGAQDDDPTSAGDDPTERADEPADDGGGGAGGGGLLGRLGLGRDVDIEVTGDEDGFDWSIEVVPADPEAVAEFEACLAEEGLDEDALDRKAEAGDLDRDDLEAAVDAFQACEPDLEDALGLAIGAGGGHRLDGLGGGLAFSFSDRLADGIEAPPALLDFLTEGERPWAPFRGGQILTCDLDEDGDA
jgi:hypothetical protein